jgi:hypothetical protein
LRNAFAQITQDAVKVLALQIAVRMGHLDECVKFFDVPLLGGDLGHDLLG